MSAASPLIHALRHPPQALRAGVAVVVLWSSVGASVAAADPAAGDPAADPAARDRGGVLERELVDVALVDADPASGTVELLTLDGSEDGLRLALVRRDQGWSELDAATVPLATGQQPAAPWLAELDSNRFVVIQPLYEERGPVQAVARTLAIPVNVDQPSGRPVLTVESAASVDLGATGSFTADVDGDGTPELVLTGDAGAPSDGCSSTAISVLAEQASSLRLVRQASVSPAAYNWTGATGDWTGATLLGEAAVGEWDGRPGSDLLIRAYPGSCDGSDIALPSTVLMIRLADLSTITELPNDIGLTDGTLLAVDVDADGRSELVVANPAALSVVDPADHWRRLVVAQEGITLLAAREQRDGWSPSLTLTSTGPMMGRHGTGIRTDRVRRIAGALAVVETTRQPFTDHSFEDVDQLIAAQVDALASRHPGVATIDVDLDGCPDLVAPMLYAGCLGSAPPRVGPAMVASRPLIRIGPADDPRLLVAQGERWSPPGSQVLDFFVSSWDRPAPALARSQGSWSGPADAPFRLAEIPLASVVSGPADSMAAPRIGTLVRSDGTIDIQGPAGARLLVRVQDLCECHVQVPLDVGGDARAFLATPLQGFETATTLRVPATSVVASGKATGLNRVDLSIFDPVTMIQTDSGTWAVTVGVLDPLGRMSDPVRAIAVYDAKAPPLSLEPPFLSAPWPFQASVGGTSEAGASVRLGNDPPVTADGQGGFQIPAQLAPWPRTLEVMATDPSGNVTTATISVMGGLDVRQVSWPPIVALAILVAAIVNSARGGSRRPRSMEVVQPADLTASQDGPVIEELDAPSPLRRR
jgi:hypothetical protein